jgi:hypothetical protein
LKDEFFSKAFREKIYGSVEEFQRDLDAFLEFHNTGRIHSGYRCEGRTPLQTLKDLMAAPMSESTELQAA